MAVDFIIAPAGITAAGIYAPGTVVDPAKPPAILADDIDETDGDLRSLFTKVHPVDAAVREAFRLREGTGSAVVGKGQRFQRIEKITGTTQRDLKDEALRVLKPFVDRGDVEVNQILTEAGESADDLGAVFVEYTNLRSGAGGLRVRAR